MQLILFSIRWQWTSNLLQKSANENPLASELLIRLLIYRSKPKEVPTYLCLGFLRAPCYSVTINRKPEKNLHILQCDANLTMWHVEGVSLGPPSPVIRPWSISLPETQKSPSKPIALMMFLTWLSTIGSRLENSKLRLL